jgi:hypothetical protein
MKRGLTEEHRKSTYPLEIYREHSRDFYCKAPVITETFI